MEASTIRLNVSPALGICGIVRRWRMMSVSKPIIRTFNLSAFTVSWAIWLQSQKPGQARTLPWFYKTNRLSKPYAGVRSMDRAGASY